MIERMEEIKKLRKKLNFLNSYFFLIEIYYKILWMSDTQKMKI